MFNILQVSRLLLLAGASPSYASDYLNGAPLTGVFASQGYHDMVSLLIEFGADVDAANAQGVTSLMFASKQGHLDVVRLLLSRGEISHILSCVLSAAILNGFNLDSYTNLPSLCPEM